jgi:hypothetical protein
MKFVVISYIEDGRFLAATVNSDLDYRINDRSRTFEITASNGDTAIVNLNEVLEIIISEAG